MQNIQYTFDDITLIPQYSEFRSRSEADTQTKFWRYTLRTPIISSNMETVTGVDMAKSIWNCGGIGSLHRFWPIEENVLAYQHVLAGGHDCLVSVGVNEESRQRAKALYNSGARMFIVDIAHGHSILMKEMLIHLKKKYPEIFIVAGNIATPHGMEDVIKWGADVVKVGIGGGSVCTTRRVTGHGVPSFSCLLDCCEVADLYNIPVIQDGGIRCSGDIVKSFVAGAEYVMLGSLLAGTDEAPGDFVFDEKGHAHKTYMGSSSYDKKGITKEGIKTSVPCKGPVPLVIKSLTGGLRSGMSYCNAKTLGELTVKAAWKPQTNGGNAEGHPHISSFMV